MEVSPPRFSADSPQQRAAASAVEAILFREILKPLAAGLGPIGELVAGSVADRLFARPQR